MAWRTRLEAAIHGPLPNPHLVFVRNDLHHFDLDNLAYPVVAVLGCDSCESVWASVGAGPIEGVTISDEVPPAPPSYPTAVSVRIESPSTASVPNRPMLPELVASHVVGDGGPVGLALEFDAEGIAVGEMSYVGPTKSLIDDLSPLLGARRWRGRTVSADDSVKELRITRGHRPAGRGVLVTVWPV
jgi:hypothetical protein